MALSSMRVRLKTTHLQQKLYALHVSIWFGAAISMMILLRQRLQGCWSHYIYLPYLPYLPTLPIGLVLLLPLSIKKDRLYHALLCYVIFPLFSIVFL
jgi:ABC-type proline/glycine betaine transport system permease subunit